LHPFGVGIVVDLGSWSVFLSKSQVRLTPVPISVGKNFAKLWLRMGLPQVGGGIGPLELVGPWIGYRVLKKKKI